MGERMWLRVRMVYLPCGRLNLGDVSAVIWKVSCLYPYLPFTMVLSPFFLNSDVSSRLENCSEDVFFI